MFSCCYYLEMILWCFVSEVTPGKSSICGELFPHKPQVSKSLADVEITLHLSRHIKAVYMRSCLAHQETNTSTQYLAIFVKSNLQELKNNICFIEIIFVISCDKWNFVERELSQFQITFTYTGYSWFELYLIWKSYRSVRICAVVVQWIAVKRCGFVDV